MGLLHEIQAAVVEASSDLGPILLKLRLLAAKLGSKPLEDWVLHESDGYPCDSPVPAYREVGVSYTGLFIGPLGRYLQNAQIPGYLIEKYAGAEWVRHQVRDGMATVDDLIRSFASHGGSLGIDASNLMLLLDGKVYEGCSCNEVRGTISAAALVSVQHAVRSRILELTIELEKAVPGAAEISIGTPEPGESANAQRVTQISQQIVYGNLTTISSTGPRSQINVSIGAQDESALVDYLVEAGIPIADASVLSEIMSGENPTSPDEPFGGNAKRWIAENMRKAADGTWQIGIAVATRVLTEAALQFYGLR